jgi:ABC-type glycerol-3-phosphate transport system substrate-binding protein
MRATKIISSLLIASFALVLTGCGKVTPVTYKINLEVWGVFDNSSTLQKLIQDYKKVNPFIGDIAYRKMSQDSYKKDLLDALAAGNGPDIFLIQNNWLPRFEDKTEPAPNWLITEQSYRDNFVDVAANDFMDQGKIYAMPLTCDSLALYYNKDLFNAAGITAPPATWKEFNADAAKLTKKDQYGNIVQSGAAMGTVYNINRSTDILGLLMIQNGVQMVGDDKKEATFDKVISSGDGKTISAGQNALDFYTQFAKINSSVYTWNSNMHYSVDAFSEQTAAMMLNYSWQYATIKSKNPKLNFAVAPVPQLYSEKPANFANYWAYAVAKNKTAPTDDNFKQQNPANFDYAKVRIYESWEFLKFLGMKSGGKFTVTNSVSGTTKDFALSSDPTEEYLKAVERPAARKDLIEKEKADVFLGPFAYGNLIAKSWYEIDPDAIETIFASMINSVNTGASTAYDALHLGASRITQLMR